ncbi:MAG TPA: indole-3-glycerol phosphate synthase TrpC [Anaerolineae bacterium]|nr:indole-3-glycerol phosphate synthase TrpC [Anaerolineae bacterium]
MKRSQRIKAAGLILDEIMAWKREELPKVQDRVPLSDLRALATTLPKPLDFVAALRPPGEPRRVRLIAEIKRASPSKGLLCQDFDPPRLAETYARGGAAAISVLTDKRFFQGSLEHLTMVKEHLRNLTAAMSSRRLVKQRKPRLTHYTLPILRKDFIFDVYQVWEARVAGADALLLIVAVLGQNDLRHLLQETHRLGMVALVEVHNEVELERALAVGARIIGINNRNLHDFSVDLDTTARLRPLIPSEVIVVSESGIRTPDDVRRLRDMDVDAILVGESLVRARPEERERQVRALVKTGRG